MRRIADEVRPQAAAVGCGSLGMRPETVRADGRRWIILSVGVAAQASFSFAFQGIPATGPLLQTAYRLTLDQLGLVMGAIAFGIAASEVVWGVLTDKLGDRAVLLVGLLSTAMVCAALAGVGSPRLDPAVNVLVLGSGFLLLGCLGGSINGSSGKAVMSWFRSGERGFAMSIRQTAIPAGGGIGAAILPFIAYRAGFPAVFTVLALASLAAAAATYVWMTKPEEPAGMPAAGAATSAASASLMRGDVWRLFVASGLLTIPQFAVLTFSAIYLIDRHGFSIATTSAVIVAVQAIGACVRVWSGRWTDRNRNRRRYIRGVALLAAVALLLLQVNEVTLDSAAVSIVLVVCAGVLGSGWHGVAYTEVAVIAGPARVGTALGIENTAVFLAAFATPALIPLLLGWISWGQIWGAIGLACLAAMLISPLQGAGDEG